MSFSDSLRIGPRDISGQIYSGKTLRPSDILTIDQHIPRIIFRNGLNVKGLNFASTTEVVIIGQARIYHIMAAGRLIVMGNVFCAAMEAGGDVVVDGSLATWVGSIEVVYGNLCVSRSVSCAGRISVKRGVIVVGEAIECLGTPDAEIVWSGLSGKPIPLGAMRVADEAEKHIRAFSGH